MIKKLVLLSIIAWLLLPTGTPDDVITIWLMLHLGSWYIVLVLFVLWLVWMEHLTIKKIVNNVKSLF